MIKMEAHYENKSTEKAEFPAVGPIHAKAPASDGSSQWETHCQQSAAASFSYK